MVSSWITGPHAGAPFRVNCIGSGSNLFEPAAKLGFYKLTPTGAVLYDNENNAHMPRLQFVTHFWTHTLNSTTIFRNVAANPYRYI